MTATQRFALIPRDGLFCKDGRGWHTSASGRGHSLDWPWPSTVLGAMRSAWGRGEEQRTGARFDPSAWRTRTASIGLGRMLLLRRSPLSAPWTVAHRAWPVTADALWLDGSKQVARLDPEPPRLPTLGHDDDPTRESLWMPCLKAAGKPLPAPRWWSEADFTTWLAGDSVAVRAPAESLAMSRRVQAHVGIRAEELTAEEGVLFSHDVVETLEHDAEWAIGLEVTLPAGDPPAVATLGSDGRLVRIEALPVPTFAPPTSLLTAFGKKDGSAGLRLVVTSPTCFARGWLPDGLEPCDGEYRGQLEGLDAEVVLRAAMLPRPLHVSGWDMAANDGRGAAKPTSRMVAPGSVYFYERVDGSRFGEADARALWLGACGTRTEEGFGRVVPGMWKPRRD